MLRRLGVIIFSALAACVAAHAQNQEIIGEEEDSSVYLELSKTPTTHTPMYTERNPLVFGAMKDNPPFAFTNDNGEPDGFNVELTKLIAKRLHIPIQINLKSFKGLKHELLGSDIHLTLSLYANTRNPQIYVSKSILCRSIAAALVPKHLNRTIGRIEDFEDLAVYIHPSTSIYHTLGSKKCRGMILVDDIHQALDVVFKNDSCVMLWNKHSLEYFKRAQGFDTQVIHPLDYSPYNIRYASTDSALLVRMDSVYQVLSAEGTIEKLENKWFNQEIQVTGYSKYWWYLLIAAGVILLVMLLARVFYFLQDRRVNREYDKQIKRLSLVLKSTNRQILSYSVPDDIYRTHKSTGERRDKFSSVGFAELFVREDFEEMQRRIRKLIDGKSETETLIVRRRVSEGHEGLQSLQMKLGVLRRDSNNRPVMLIGVYHDLSEYEQRKVNTQHSLLRYQSVFDQDLLDIAIFDQSGVIRTMNSKAMRTFGISTDDLAKMKHEHFSLTDFPGYPADFDFTVDSVHTEFVLDFDKKTDRQRFFKSRGQIHYEMKIIPLTEKSGKMTSVVFMGHDISDHVHAIETENNVHRKLEEHQQDLRRYIDDVNNALTVANVFTGSYYPDMGRYTFDVDGVQKEYTQSAMLRLVAPECRESVIKMLDRQDRCEYVEEDVTLRLLYKDPEDNVVRERMIRFDVLPITQDGRIDHYTLFCRDVTSMSNDMQRLEEETQKAHEAEKLKNIFLNNMSHEIQKPVSEVLDYAMKIGSGLPSDVEKQYAQKIQDTTNGMLSMLRDIMTLSEIDDNSMALNKQYCDFTTFFTSRVSESLADVPPEVTTFINDPYDSIELEVDLDKVGRVLNAFCKLSLSTTKRGRISAMYEYFSNQLLIKIEDTGEGMDDQQAKQLFERTLERHNVKFASRLKLVIAAEITKAMGGDVYVDSKPYRGTSVWITLPCKARNIVRKQSE